MGDHFLHIAGISDHDQVGKQVQAAHGFLLLLVLLAAQGPVAAEPGVLLNN
ncbi:hypothetical protein GKZ68_21270 (plasmid) [Hymenobacter sp. BRD128]|uniref:hypothetical protein n=1 Tax=Hymenobacter sp. BRD128 TaxID=2675878 RepID=UPI00156399A3|nr:hypothetical protein [Hymenobacter sp. BRD128]QKG59174.1 hypothetical protein GKZ68_21270 [Hymenobacter sp. BRD128]